MLQAIQPYLLIKGVHCQLGLDFLDLPPVRVSFEARGKTWPRRVSVQEDLDVREAFKVKMGQLNERGSRAS